jgi:DNA invertase Pin-like site-specific DNA recombinase
MRQPRERSGTRQRRASCRKKRGVKFGPKPKLAAHQAREAARMVRVEGKSLRDVAHHYRVGHSTVVRALERVEMA